MSVTLQPKLPHALAQQVLQRLPTIGHCAPPMLIEWLAGSALNDALAPALKAGALTELTGRWLAIDCIDWPYPLRISRTGERLVVSTRRGPIDASIRGGLAAFLVLLRQQVDPDTLFFQRKLIMQGDTELALSVKNFLDTLEREQMPAALRWLLQHHDVTPR